MYRHIIVGYDGAEHARDAATLALDAPCALIVVPRGVPALGAQTANEVGVVDAG